MIADITIMISVLFIAMMSPGPDMMLILRYNLSSAPRSSLFCILGVCAGLCIHILLALIGFAALIASGGLAYQVIKLIGAAYLMYIGFQIYNAPRHSTDIETSNTLAKTATYKKAFHQGFITNLLNPKVMIFTLALFTQIMTPDDPIAHKLIMTGVMLFTVFSVWCAFIMITRQNIFLNFLKKYEHRLNITFGILLILFGGALALKP